jgi:hypothetical protein
MATHSRCCEIEAYFHGNAGVFAAKMKPGSAKVHSQRSKSLGRIRNNPQTHERDS